MKIVVEGRGVEPRAAKVKVFQKKVGGEKARRQRNQQKEHKENKTEQRNRTEVEVAWW